MNTQITPAPANNIYIVLSYKGWHLKVHLKLIILNKVKNTLLRTISTSSQQNVDLKLTIQHILRIRVFAIDGSEFLPLLEGNIGGLIERWGIVYVCVTCNLLSTSPYQVVYCRSVSIVMNVSLVSNCLFNRYGGSLCECCGMEHTNRQHDCIELIIPRGNEVSVQEKSSNQ